MIKSTRLGPRLVTRLLVLSVMGASVQAATMPKFSPADRRIGFVDYQAHDVVIIPTALGVVTRIVMADDERIVRPPDSGFPAACEEPLNEWCIRAEVGSNQITVKPRKGATQTNLEVSTDKREYSFVIHAMPGAEKSKTVLFRVIFRYPMPAPPVAHVSLALPETKPSEATTGQASFAPKRQELARPVVHNVSYSVQAQGQSQSILPSVIFDDGRFTYMKFPKAREVPAVFAIDGSGKEVRVAFHSDRLLADPASPDSVVENDYLVIRRTARGFTLRLGELVASIINNNFDADGIETHNGTTTPTLRREVKP